MRVPVVTFIGGGWFDAESSFVDADRFTCFSFDDAEGNNVMVEYEPKKMADHQAALEYLKNNPTVDFIEFDTLNGLLCFRLNGFLVPFLTIPASVFPVDVTYNFERALLPAR